MAGKIPAKFIDDLLTRVDIVELIDSYVPLRKMGKDFKACCPFHDEKTPSFTVSADKQFYHCFGCGAHGTAIGFLMEYERMGFREAVEELANRAGLTVPEEARAQPVAQQESVDRLLDALQQAARFFQRQLREHPQAANAVAYLKERGLTGEIAAKFGLGFAPESWDALLRGIGAERAMQEALFQAGLLVKKDSGGYYDRFRNRVMFPIHDYRGRIVGFGGRILGKGEPKYLNSPETPLFHKGRELYGLFRARDAIKRENRVVVVEGYMDVVALAQYGIDYAVATLGTATTRDHLERLYRFAPEVVFCFDGDRAGREAAWRALENAMPVLHEGRQAGFLFLPEGEDPDTLVRKEGASAFAARLRKVVPLPDFLFQGLAERVDLNRLDGRATLVELARPLLLQVTPGVLREMMVRRLSELARLQPEKLATLLYGEEPSRGREPPRRRQFQPHHGKPSLVRTAIAMLVQRPDLARQVADPEVFSALDAPGIPLFASLLKELHTEPRLNTAALLQRFSESEHAQTLAKLAVLELEDVPDPGANFVGAIDELVIMTIDQEIERLSNKQDQGGLTQAEKTQLRDLHEEKRRRRDSRA